jgi:hypothetical protein
MASKLSIFLGDSRSNKGSACMPDDQKRHPQALASSPLAKQKHILKENSIPTRDLIVFFFQNLTS